MAQAETRSSYDRVREYQNRISRLINSHEYPSYYATDCKLLQDIF